MRLSRLLVQISLVMLVLSGCTAPPAANRRDYSGESFATGPAGAPAGVPFFATSDGFLRSLANLVAVGVKGAASTNEVGLDQLRARDADVQHEVVERYRRELEAACREKGLALAPTADTAHVSIETRLVSTEPLEKDRLLVSVETTARSRESGQVLWRHEYRAVIGDRGLEPAH